MYTKPFTAYFTEEASIVFECVEKQMQLLRTPCMCRFISKLYTVSTPKAAIHTPTL